MKVWKVVKFCVPTCPVFTGLVTYYMVLDTVSLPPNQQTHLWRINLLTLPHCVDMRDLLQNEITFVWVLKFCTIHEYCIILVNVKETDEAVANLENGYKLICSKLERLKEYFCEDDSNFDGKIVFDNLVYLLKQLPAMEKASAVRFNIVYYCCKCIMQWDFLYSILYVMKIKI